MKKRTLLQRLVEKDPDNRIPDEIMNFFFNKSNISLQESSSLQFKIHSLRKFLFIFYFVKKKKRRMFNKYKKANEVPFVD